jgi:hypothetical protein
MTATTDAAADAVQADVPEVPGPDGGLSMPQQAAGRPVVAIELLTAHPGNVPGRQPGPGVPRVDR